MANALASEKTVEIPCRRCFSRVSTGMGNDFGNTFRGGKCFACGGTRVERLTVAQAAEVRAEAIAVCQRALAEASALVAKGRQAHASAAKGRLDRLAAEIAMNPHWPAPVVARAVAAAARIRAEATAVEEAGR